jgi:PD-(D/E)XK nuclease superfamily
MVSTPNGCTTEIEVHRQLGPGLLVDRLMPVHDAQLLTYLRLSGISTGLLLNFNSAVLKDGLRRLVL